MTRDTTWPSSSVCIWPSLVQVQTTILAEIQEQEKELKAPLPSLSSRHPFSFLALSSQRRPRDCQHCRPWPCMQVKADTRSSEASHWGRRKGAERAKQHGGRHKGSQPCISMETQVVMNISSGMDFCRQVYLIYVGG